jgi:hypothetical protein
VRVYTNPACKHYQHFLILFSSQNTIKNSKAKKYSINDLMLFLVFNATFSNISAISWRPILVVEEAGVPGENHRPWGSNW